MGIEDFPKVCLTYTWKDFRWEKEGSGRQQEPDPEKPRAGGARKERKRLQGRMGGGRKQKEMEERKRKGRVLSLWSSAGPSGVTMGRKGRKHVVAEGTGSMSRGHHTPPVHTPPVAA